jgi:murein DD-endopeptidase MepM/ murein hydrolase activator NlpD
MLNNPFWRKKHFITQYFWENPQMYAQFWWKGHNGIDFRCNEENIFATHPWIVTAIEDTKGYGKHVKIKRMMNDWWYETIYAHLSKIYVKTGDFVTSKQVIGKSGNTGNSTWPHLHLSLMFYNPDGTIKDKNNGYWGFVDPLPYFIPWKI